MEFTAAAFRKEEEKRAANEMEVRKQQTQLAIQNAFESGRRNWCSIRLDTPVEVLAWLKERGFWLNGDSRWIEVHWDEKPPAN